MKTLCHDRGMYIIFEYIITNERLYIHLMIFIWLLSFFSQLMFM